MFKMSIEILIAPLKNHQRDCVGVFFLIILHCAKIISHTFHCVFSQCKETASDTSSHHSPDKMI